MRVRPSSHNDKVSRKRLTCNISNYFDWYLSVLGKPIFITSYLSSTIYKITMLTPLQSLSFFVALAPVLA